ncbi:MAG: TIGR02285 family protein [Pseudomonadales bacterium]
MKGVGGALAALLLSLSCSVLAEQKTVIWTKYDFEPVHIARGENAGLGMSDLLFDYLQQGLPNYVHVEEYSNIPRILKDLKGPRTICSSLLKTPEREGMFLFSDATLLIPNHSVQFLATRKSELEKKYGLMLEGQISLAQLVAHPQALFGLIRNRSHGPVADKLLSAREDKVIFRSGSFDLLGLVEMMKKRRFDFTVEYPYVSYYELSKQGRESEIYSVAIDNAGASLHAHLACSDTPTGRALISQVNTLLRSSRASERHRALVERWLPNSARQDFRRKYADFVAQMPQP